MASIVLGVRPLWEAKAVRLAEIEAPAAVVNTEQFCSEERAGVDDDDGID